MSFRISRAPWLTLSLVAPALLILWLPDSGTLLEYRRAAVDSGELWRILTGQLVHWTPRMGLADLGMILLLGAWLEGRSRPLTLLALGGSFLLVGSGLHLLATDVSFYRGSSGVASALFVVAAIEPASRPSRPWVRGTAWAMLVVFTLKLLWEQWTGTAIAAGPLPPGITVTPQVHLLGAVAGVLALGLRPVASKPGAIAWPRRLPACLRHRRKPWSRDPRHEPGAWPAGWSIRSG